MAMDSSSILRKRTSPRHDIGASFEGRGYTSDEVAGPPKCRWPGPRREHRASYMQAAGYHGNSNLKMVGLVPAIRKFS